MLVNIFEQDEYLKCIVAFLDGESVNNLHLINFCWRNLIDEDIWKILCSVAAFKTKCRHSYERTSQMRTSIETISVWNVNPSEIIAPSSSILPVESGQRGSALVIQGDWWVEWQQSSTLLIVFEASDTGIDMGRQKGSSPRLKRKENTIRMLLLQKIPFDVRKIKKGSSVSE